MPTEGATTVTHPEHSAAVDAAKLSRKLRRPVALEGRRNGPMESLPLVL